MRPADTFPAGVSMSSKGRSEETTMNLRLNAVAFAVAALASGHNAWAGEAEAKKWIDAEFQPSTLS
jgi:hypothetical protein